MEIVDNCELSQFVYYVSRTTEDITRTKDCLMQMYRWLKDGVPMFALKGNFHDSEIEDAFTMLADGVRETRVFIDGMIQREKNGCVGCMYGKRDADGCSCLKGYDTTIVCNDYIPNN